MINLESLSRDLIENICIYLQIKDTLAFIASSKTLYEFDNDPNIWEYYIKIFTSKNCLIEPRKASETVKKFFQRIYHVCIRVRKALMGLINRFQPNISLEPILIKNFYSKSFQNDIQINAVISKYINKFPFEVYLLFRFLNGETDLHSCLSYTPALFGGISYRNELWEFQFHPIEESSNELFVSMGFHPLAIHELFYLRIYVDVFGRLKFGAGAIFSIIKGNKNFSP